MKKQLLALVAAIAAAFTITSNAETGEPLPGVAAQPASYFYTGKPYDQNLAGYVFAYRNYDPELNRWLTTDPSGFPDGANNQVYVPAPISMFDPTGLAVETYDQYFGRAWETATYVTIETDTSISLSGVSVSVGASSSGPSASLSFGFTINTTSTVVNSSSSTQLVTAQDDPNPTGSGWQQVGNYTTSSENSSTSKIVHNYEISPDRFQSTWNTQTTHVGYIRWERE